MTLIHGTGSGDELLRILAQHHVNLALAPMSDGTVRGLADSVIRGGTGGIGSLVNPAESNKDWTKLSDRERDRILQSMSEGFPPEYRTVLERYYRRLADEKTASPAGGTSKAKAKEAQKGGTDKEPFQK